MLKVGKFICGLCCVLQQSASQSGVRATSLKWFNARWRNHFSAKLKLSLVLRSAPGTRQLHILLRYVLNCPIIHKQVRSQLLKPYKKSKYTLHPAKCSGQAINLLTPGASGDLACPRPAPQPGWRPLMQGKVVAGDCDENCTITSHHHEYTPASRVNTPKPALNKQS